MATLTTIRQLAAAIAGRYYSGTAKSSGSTTTTFIIENLISSISQDDLHSDKWVYAPAASAADAVRVSTTYTPSTGTITVDAAVSGSTVYNSKAIELHGFLDPTTGTKGEGFGWTTAINEALKRIMIETEFTITPTANAIRHDLSTTVATWLTEPEWVRDVGVMTSSEVRAEVDPYKHRHVRGRPERISGVVYYNHGRSFGSNETIYVKALRPAYTLCAATGAAYGTQATGLSAETDIEPVEASLVAWGAIQEALLRYRFAVGKRAQQEDDLDALLEKATIMWSSLLPKHSDIPSDVPVYAREIRSFGPGRH